MITDSTAPALADDGSQKHNNGMPAITTPPPMAEKSRAYNSLRRALGSLLKLSKFVGPGFMVSVAYIDPGNYATDVAAGAATRFKLLFVVLLSNMIALVLQSLAIRLGSVTGLNLAEHCRLHLPKWLNILLYLFAEAAIIATDIAEVRKGVVECFPGFIFQTTYLRLIRPIGHWFCNCLESSSSHPARGRMCHHRGRGSRHLDLLQTKRLHARAPDLRALHGGARSFSRCLLLHSTFARYRHLCRRSLQRLPSLFHRRPRLRHLSQLQYRWRNRHASLPLSRLRHCPATSSSI